MERIWQRTSRSSPSRRHDLRAGLQMRPQRALALVAHEEEQRAGVVDELAQVVTTRPPVSIPLAATMIIGRGASAMARDRSASDVVTCARDSRAGSRRPGAAGTSRRRSRPG